MIMCLGPALRRQAGRLVEHEGDRALVDDHLAHQLRLFLGQRLALAFRSRRPRGHRVRWRKLNRLTGLDSVARRGSLAVDAQLTGPRPARDDVEADLRQVPLEPAVKADAVVLVVYGEFARLGHAG